MSNSQNGWPLLEYGSPRLHTWNIPTKQGMVRVTLRNGSAGFLLAIFFLWWSEKIEPLIGKVLDDWGFAPRPIRGSSEPSNHGSGTAGDTNATQHPLGVRGTLTAAEKRLIAHILGKKFKGTLRHGAFYEGRVDEMHVEINQSLPFVEARARALMNTRRGKKILDANPGQRAVIMS